MKEIYLIATGKDRLSYTVDTVFENLDDAKKYIETMKFYTPNDLWIINSTEYFKNEYKIPDYGDPIITVYLNNNKVINVYIANIRDKNIKEERSGNIFRFRLAREKNESLEEFLHRAKAIAIQKQNEYMK